MATPDYDGPVIRTDETGTIWICRKRSEGWSNPGRCFTKWESVFHAVRPVVGEKGVDEAGEYLPILKASIDLEAL